MAFKVGNRTQQTYLPSTIEEYVGPMDPARVYDAFVEALDFNALGISLVSLKGAERFYPKQMMKLILYGYAYGIRSSRQLERACRHNLSFMWLSGGLQPDYRTLARFRSEYRLGIQAVMKQCTRMCVEMDLVEGNTLFVDGSKFRANAGIKHTWSRKKLEKELEKNDEHIERLMKKGIATDEAEAGKRSLVEMEEELQDRQQLKVRMEACLSKMGKKPGDKMNLTDPESTTAKSRQGTHPIHNVQVVTDGKHGLIVQAQRTEGGNDNQELAPQIAAATQNIGHKIEVVCTDAGYYNPKQTQAMEEKVVMPTPTQAHAEKVRVKGKEPKKPSPYHKSQFQYDENKDEYVCPGGKRLTHQWQRKGEQKYQHIYQAKGIDCRQCEHWEKCTKAKAGRKVVRSEYEEEAKKQATIYQSEEGQATYKQRKQRAELPFGHFKRGLQAGQFLLRGKEKVNAEVSLLATCFNLRRMMTIVGINPLIRQLQPS